MKKIFLSIILFFVFLGNYNLTFSDTDNIRTSSEITRTDRSSDINILNKDNKFFDINTTWEKWIKKLLIVIARDAKNIIFFFVLIIWIVMVIKLIFWNNTEEEAKKLKMWILWVSIWIIVMQSAFWFYKVLFDKDIWNDLANNFTHSLIQPFIDLLLLLTSFVFITVWIIAFYKIITDLWDGEKAKQWKMTIFYAVIWFIVVKFSHLIVKNTYDPNCGWWWLITIWWTQVCENISDNAKLIVTIINWLNWFVAIITILLVIYAWFLILTSAWDDEKQKKAKNIILYIAIWMLILITSYLILKFFILPENPI